MAQNRQSATIAIILVAVLLFCPASAGKNRVRKSNYNYMLPSFEQQLEENEKQIRMTNSEAAQQNQYPYMVALMLFDNETESFYFHCGGSLISSTQILTAAHCVCHDETNKTLKAKEVKIALGAHFFNATINDAQLTKKIRRIKIHERYNPKTWFNDIAILTMASPVEFTETISPVCLPPQETNDQYVGQLAIVKGWGATGEEEIGSNYLLHGVLSIISNSVCQKIYIKDEHFKQKIPTHMMCAYRRGIDSCQGDSGGPLVIESDDLNENNELNVIESEDDNNTEADEANEADAVEEECRWIQVGVVSFGNGCGVKGVPGVYMRITSFLHWIKKNKI